MKEPKWGIRNDGFSFIESLMALCILSVLLLLLSSFSENVIRAEKKLSASCDENLMLLNAARKLSDLVSETEVFPFGKKIRCSFSEKFFQLEGTEKKLISFLLPEGFSFKKSEITFYRDFPSGIIFVIEYSGGEYTFGTHFADYFPGCKELH